ncbi:squalene cyclase [Methylopila henanensis]|uniref:Squalene cyclase n=1 Tax=Methylopila henanensis TaxID=873516 RepID=A0ABW4K5X2_9HYPH
MDITREPWEAAEPVIGWLLDADPALRWQVMRDILDAPDAEWLAERGKVETEGWGARLFALQDADGRWDGGAFAPAGFTQQDWQAEGQPWTPTCWTLAQLREFGLAPTCACARRTVRLIGENARWEHDGQPYWEGEVEECINGRTVAAGAYFGVDVDPIVERLLGERQPDGGWNCERTNGSRVSSFDTTISVLEGLIEHERATGGSDRTREARRTAEEYLLRRDLFRRLSTGEPANPDYLASIHPDRWRYNVLRALDYFRDASNLYGTAPDTRLGPAISYLMSRRLPDGRWPLDKILRGRVWFAVDDGEGEPSRWITLRALRILKWWRRRSEESQTPQSAARA